MKAFKEWQGICEALASGGQSIILRKGGIHEGREGFSFAEESFLLFPTRFHGQADAIRTAAPPEKPEWQVGEEVTITHFARAEWAVTLTDWDKVAELAPHHIWTEQTIRDRYEWTGKGMPGGSIHCAFVRVYKLAEPWTFSYEKKHGGCRSWLELADAAADILEGMTPVLDDATFSTCEAQLSQLVAQ